MNRVPKLRFKEFSGDWEEKIFSELVKKEKKITYGVVKPGEFCDNGIFLIKASDYSKGWNLENLFKISKELDFSYRRSKVNEGDILFTIVGSVGNTAIVPKYLENSNITQQTARLSIDNDFFSNIFIYNFLSTIQNRKQTLNYLKEGVQPSINLADLEKFKIFIPTLQEQQKIADFLSSVDKKISITEEKLDLFKEYKKGIMQKIFNQELRFKDSNGNDYPEWEEKKLENIVSINKGKQLNKEFLSEDDKYPVINGGIFPSGYTDSYNYFANTITISEGGNSCGYVNFIKKDFWAGGHCYVLEKKEDINYKYLYQVLKSNEANIMDLRVGSGLPNIQKKSISEYKIKVSKSLEEQEKIANFLSSIDNKIENLVTELEDLKEFKKGLLQQMFV